MNRTIRTMVALSLASATAACSDASSGPSTNGGPYSYTVAGDLEGTFSGNTAVFGLQANDQGIGQWFINTLEVLGNNIQGVSIVYNGQSPGTGTFAIADVDLKELPANQFGAFLSLVAEGEGAGYIGNSLSGTITITENSAAAVKATFQFTAAGTAFPANGDPESAMVVVTGEVDAIPAN